MLKGTEKDLKTIARELNVQYVLEGSVRKAGNDLRIVAQLIEANTDTHLWAEKYKGTLEDVFDIQEVVSEFKSMNHLVTKTHFNRCDRACPTLYIIDFLCAKNRILQQVV